SEQEFINQLHDLQHYLNDSHEEGSVQAKVKATPLSTHVPEQWVLSSSGQSGYFAAHFGMGFSFAHFINPVGGHVAVQMYRERFKPSANLAEPQANFATFMFCSDDEERVKQVRAVAEYRFIMLETKGRFDAVDYND